MDEIQARVAVMRRYWGLWRRHLERCAICNPTGKDRCNIGSIIYQELVASIDLVMKADPEDFTK